MVELQETLSFDDQILPLLLKEREKYNGKLTEESTGTVNTLSVNRISHVKMRRWRSEQGFGLIFICFLKIDADSLKKKLEARFCWTRERLFHYRNVEWCESWRNCKYKKKFRVLPSPKPMEIGRDSFQGKMPIFDPLTGVKW